MANQERTLLKYFNIYSESHQDGTNKIIHWICIPMIMFGLLGLVWAVPFPHIGFLGDNNIYLNWASFLIAFSIYYYYRLSPVLSYAMLLVIMLMAYGIVLLEHWEAAGGPALWQVSLGIFIASWIGQFIGHKIEGKKPSFLDDVRFLLIGPVWLVASVFDKFKLRY